MANFLKAIGIVMGASLLVLVIAVVARDASHEQSFGSVTQNGEYHSTTTLIDTPAGIYYVTVTSTAASNVLGSIIITSSTPAVGFKVEDANGTSTSTIAVFNASPVVGTYTIDRFIRYGIAITVPAGFNGNIITTYR